MSLIKDYLYTKRIMNPQKLLTQREQLMWDIDGIIDEFAQHNSPWITEDDMEDLIRVLCDAVCKNFPNE
jgi:trehalose-6-phosphatase